jgi:hypothetical protein
MNKRILVLIFFVAILLSCSKDNNSSSTFVLRSEFDTIRSCPNGGGIFIVGLVDTASNIGHVNLSIEALSGLNASCTRSVLNEEFPVAEIVIKPEEEISIEDHKITVRAANSTYDTTFYLTVSIYDWSAEIGEDILLKKNEFDSWLQNEFPDLTITPGMEWEAYPTYPQILIVEHYTFLNNTYEYRICKHAMIPPYDWSMIRLRKRNEAEPLFAAKQDSTGGTMYQIPVDEYPEMFGY